MRLEGFENKTDIKFAALESKMDIKFAALESKMDTKFEAVNQRIDYIFWLLSFNAALIIFILGFIIWDRRTALRPALDKASLAKEESSKALIIMRTLAQKYPEIADELKMHGLL